MIEIWRERQGEELLPLQSAAARGGLLDLTASGRSFLINAPTSAGKSFCGELALAQALMQKRKGALLVPLKSIAEERFAAYSELCGQLGLRALIATADYPESDSALANGDFDIAICVYEKFNRLLLGSIDSLARLGVVVIDELQLTQTDPERGACLRGILRKMYACQRRTALVGLMSGAGAAELAEILDLTLIKQDHRPLELRRGVAVSGRYDYHAHNSGAIGSEAFPLGSGANSPDETDSLASLITELSPALKSAGRKLVFLSSKQKTVRAALALAGQVNWPRAESALSQLDDAEPSAITRALRQALTRGVAFHSADLSAEARRTVESAYHSGAVRVIFCTSTLALGVNLPADTVIIEPLKHQAGPVNGYLGGPRSCGVTTATPLSRAEFDSIAGRAGRFGLSGANKPEQVARAVTLARSEFERDLLWDMYIEPSQEQTPARPAQLPTEYSEYALELLLSGLATSETDLRQRFKADPFGIVGDSIERLNDALSALEVAGLIERSADRSLHIPRATRLGRLAGLSLAGIAHCRFLAETSRPTSEREWLAAALGIPDLERAARLPLGCNEVRAEQELYAAFPDEAANLFEFLCPSSALGGRTRFTGRGAARVRALLTLELWRSGAEARLIEQRTRTTVTQVAALADTAVWLLSALAEIYRALDRSFDSAGALTNLRMSLRAGLPLAVARGALHATGLLNRSELMRLAALKISAAEQLAGLSERALADSLADASLGGAPGLKRRLAQITADVNQKNTTNSSRENSTHRGWKENQMSMQPITAINGTINSEINAANTVSAVNSVAPHRRSRTSRAISAGTGFAPTSLELDGGACGERFLARVDGAAVPLTAKSFKYLLKLAVARLMGEDGWIYKDEIEAGFNQARYLYRMRGELESGLAGVRWAVYENNRLGYYRLGLEAAAISVNLETLVENPDFEIAECARGLQAWRRKSA